MRLCLSAVQISRIATFTDEAHVVGVQRQKRVEFNGPPQLARTDTAYPRATNMSRLCQKHVCNNRIIEVKFTEYISYYQ